jgi:hypothetical protein
MTREQLDVNKEQVMYLILPRLKHDDWCRDWETCCTAKENLSTLLDMVSAMPGDGDEAVDALNAFEIGVSVNLLWEEHLGEDGPEDG